MTNKKQKTQVAEDEPVALSGGVKNFPIVGIGASAGGLAAFEAFFSGMPADANPGMAFVLVQHLAPDHTSILTDLIRRYTRMQVFEVTDGMVVKPDCVYIIPPNRDMAFIDGTLQLLEPAAPRGQRLPIDFFFRSLAHDQHERAIGVVLSGTGSDGTAGIRAIKGEGGLVVAQKPESTEYDGMPCNAIATGLVDFEILPKEMPDKIMAYATQAFGKAFRMVSVTETLPDTAMKKIFVLLRTQTGHDFSQYKPSTINRRIERRMAVNQIELIGGYVKHLQRDSGEVQALFRDLLIGVTSFFRDPGAFQILEEKVIPKIFANKTEGAAIRVWSSGCSTGEEAYSLAILLAEGMEARKKSFAIQVFATDIDNQAIATARAGIYPASIVIDISPERLSRFFSLEPGGHTYRIHKGIRDLVVFSEQDVVKDPPFSKLDLISCRNVMIYMGSTLQKKLIPLFHYALNPGGTLFLGTSETTGDFSSLFSALDSKQKIYQRKEDFIGTRRAAIDHFVPLLTAVDSILPSRAAGKHVFSEKLPLRELTEQALLQQVIAAGALVSGHGDILYLHGRTGMFLEPAPGEAGINNILKMAREGLKNELTMALHKAAGIKETVCHPGLSVKTNGHFTTVNLTVRPVTTGAGASPESPLFLIILEEASEAELKGRSPEVSGPTLDPDARIAALQRELRAKEEYLQSANEEMQSSNEELKSSNEELQSVNEEMQSTNEELETSKEELQSVNEELSTVNTELQTKMLDLTRVNNDMNNLLSGTGIATVFVDYQLRILRFTPTATEIINLIPADAGRPVSHIVSNLMGYGRLVADTQGVLDTLIPKEVEVQTTSGRWFSLHIQPYRTLANVIEGAVMTFVEITEVVRTRKLLQESEERFKRLFVEAPLGIALIDSLTGRFHEANPMFAKIAGRTVAEMVQIDWMSITHPDDVQKNLDQMALLNAGTISGFQMEKRYLRPNGPAVWINMTIAPVMAEDKANPWHLCMIEDITVRKQAEEALKKANDQLRLSVVVADAHDAITVQDLKGQIIAWNPGAVRMYGWSEAEALTMNVHDRIPEALRKNAMTKLVQLGQAEILEPYCSDRITKQGKVVKVSIISTALFDETGKMYAVATTERAKAGGGK
jgi:two-component system CheB/CheR fusion protein